MKKFSLASMAVAAALMISPVFVNAQTYNFSYNDGSDTATGTLVVSSLGGGAYGILGGTITIAGPNGYDGTGVVLADPNGAGNAWVLANPPNSGGADYIADNLFFPGGNPQLDDDGFNFDLTSYKGPSGFIPGNIWGNGPDNYTILEGAYNIYSNGSFSATPAPEGGASLLYLLLAGAACFGAMILTPRNGLGRRA